ncbi:MAG: Klebsiella phage [Pseudomonadota bacterium]|jgi:NTP pyrophosphatase (non-canonical NTP hydrolase)
MMEMNVKNVPASGDMGPDYIQMAIDRFDQRAASAQAFLESGLGQPADRIKMEKSRGMADAIRALSAQKVTLQHHIADQSSVKSAGETLQRICHGAAAEAGWWTDLHTGEPMAHRPHFVGEKLMLVVSEIAEAMEGHRKGLQDDKLPHRQMIEVELADAVIRIADLAGGLGLDLGGAIEEKLAFNAQRADHKPEARKALGGKAY